MSKMEGIEHAQEALTAFRAFTRKIYPSPFFSSQEPVLVLFNDGSGSIKSTNGETVYLSFTDLNDLLLQLTRRTKRWQQR